MKKTNLLFLAIFMMLGMSCETEQPKFPITKRYWTPSDYTFVIRELKYGYKKDERLPSFSDPNTRVIVEKLTDQQNYKVVLTDSELGLKYKSEVATEFFNQWRDMSSVYDAVDRKDKYIYEKEMLAVWHFGLQLQLYYFKLGNDEMIKDADSPDERQTKYNVTSNVNSLINNFTYYLDEVNRENQYSENGLQVYAKGIDNYLTQLVEIYPGDYDEYPKMITKIDLLLKKVQSSVVRNSLENLKKSIQNRG